MTMAINSIIIAGHIDFDPAACPAVLTDAAVFIGAAQTQPGCVAYNWAFDPLVPGRVQVFEEWASEQALHDHFAGPRYAEMGAHLIEAGMRDFSIRMYGVAVSEPVYDENNRPRALFFAGKR